MLRDAAILSKNNLWFALLTQKPFGFLGNLSGRDEVVVLSKSPDSEIFDLEVALLRRISLLFANVENKRS